MRAITKMAQLSDIVGETVVSAVVDVDTATLRFVGGGILRLVLEGDCCSRSYFTDETQFTELVGTKILEAEETQEEPSGFKEYATEGTESLIWSFLKFKTDKGHVTIDWRNDSNGYYSGWMNVYYTPGPDLPLAKVIFCVGMDETSAAVWADYCAYNGVYGYEVSAWK